MWQCLIFLRSLLHFSVISVEPDLDGFQRGWWRWRKLQVIFFFFFCGSTPSLQTDTWEAVSCHEISCCIIDITSFVYVHRIHLSSRPAIKPLCCLSGGRSKKKKMFGGCWNMNCAFILRVQLCKRGRSWGCAGFVKYIYIYFFFELRAKTGIERMTKRGCWYEQWVYLSSGYNKTNSRGDCFAVMISLFLSVVLVQPCTRKSRRSGLEAGLWDFGRYRLMPAPTRLI